MHTVFFLSSFWVVCADMAAQYTVPDPTTPGKMFMTYQGLASYLSSGGQLTPSNKDSFIQKKQSTQLILVYHPTCISSNAFFLVL